MVQVIENGTDISCIIIERTASSSLGDYDDLTVRIATAAPVEGLADLIGPKVGSHLNLLVLRSLLPEGDLQGWQLRCRAALVGPGTYMAEKDPPPERFQLTPP